MNQHKICLFLKKKYISIFGYVFVLLKKKMDSSSSSSSSDGEYGAAAKRGGATKRGGAKKKFNKKTKCALCGENFEGVLGEDPNEPTTNPCGCTFHEYCLYKASFGDCGR